MRRGFRQLWALVVAFVAVALLAGQLPASAAGVAHDRVVSDVPSTPVPNRGLQNLTPQILDGKVTDIEQVGGRIVVTGTFTRVQNVGMNGSTIFNRSKVFAFDAGTGAVDTAFAPAVTAAAINTAAAGPDDTVYLGGSISAVNGTNIRNIAQVSLATGALTAFRPAGLNGVVNDLQVSGPRLYVAGAFTTAGGQPHGGLATLSLTGTVDAYMGVDVAVNHNWTSTCTTCARGAVGVSKIDITSDGQRLVAIGNFKQADGLIRDQVVVVLLPSGGAVVDPGWRTRRYEPACKSQSFDSYVRDVEYAPDGSYFVITTTGARYPGTLCDTAARWNTSDTGDDVQPRWIADAGGDTLLSVAVTGAAVYVGGHQRWMNNSYLGGTVPSPGAVPRPGIAALDPRNGVPLPWNPGRNPRGYGAEALLATSTGLYVGMDTEWFGNFQLSRKRLGFFPLVGAAAPASQATRSLPATVWLAGRAAATAGAGVNDVLTRFYDGTTAAPDAQGPDDGVAWSQARGAFMVGDTLYYGFPDSAGSYQLVRRTFDGTTFGPATFITTPYLDPDWAGVATGSGTSTYDGKLPNFYGAELASVTGMFYADGKLYYTKTGSTALFSRGFSVDSGIVEAVSRTVAASGFDDAGGMFVSNGSLYVANRSTGDLRRMAFTNGVPSGALEIVSGPSRDGRNWNTRALFLGPDAGAPPVNAAPVAAFTSSCTGLACTFDASGSTDPEGTALTYEWAFGDGSTGTGESVSHEYPAAGTYPVSLTVRDGAGATGTTTRQVTVSQAPAGQAIGVVGSGGTQQPRSVTSISVPVPAGVEAGDGMVLILSTNSAVTGTAPDGFTSAGSQTSLSGTSVAMTTEVFEKVATGTEAGSLAVTLGGSAKATLQLVVYSGTATGAAGPVKSVTGLGRGSATTHTTPSVTAAAGDWALEVWSDKSASARTWTAPTGVTVRSNLGATGTAGEIATLVADSGAASPGGSVGGHTATVSVASSRATVLTVLLSPAP